jgi:hypothetical protein
VLVNAGLSRYYEESRDSSQTTAPRLTLNHYTEMQDIGRRIY